MAEPAFTSAGQSPGLELWRIEKMKPVKQTGKVTGKFYSGDSYILLSTVKKGNSLSHSIHFWLGDESSQDEKGVAAYKTVELDDALGGGPHQYRELQGHESNEFLSLFKNNGGVQYLSGGIESGFTHVERDTYPARLLKVKGRRNVRVEEVEVSSNSLNSGDVFILDKGLAIYVYEGATSNRMEKVKASMVVKFINDDERGSRANITRISDDEKNEVFLECSWWLY